jgi:hypothetical protein
LVLRQHALALEHLVLARAHRRLEGCRRLLALFGLAQGVLQRLTLFAQRRALLLHEILGTSVGGQEGLQFGGHLRHLLFCLLYLAGVLPHTGFPLLKSTRPTIKLRLHLLRLALCLLGLAPCLLLGP